MSGSTIYYVAQSIDGFIADRDHGLSWLLEFGFDDFQQQYDEFLDGVGAIVMGAGTLRWLAAEGEPWGYAGTPTWVVASGELPSIAGATYERSTDALAAIGAARAAAGEKNVWVVGGGTLAGSLADAGALDELHLTIMPLTLGTGVPVLPHGAASIPWQLQSTRPIGSAGAVELRYRVRSS